MTTDQNPFSGESPKNYEQKCACVLVLDVSGSMAGDPLTELQSGLQVFRDAVLADFVASQRLEVSLVTFCSDVQTAFPFSGLDGTTFPTLTAQGTTKLADGVRRAIAEVEARKSWYRSTGQNYYRPIIVLITDGAPDSDQDVEGLSQDIRSGVANKKFLFWAVGVKGYRHDILQKIAPTDTPPLPLDGLKFAEFFRWLSNSIQIVTKSNPGDIPTMPAVSEWTQVKL